MENSMKNINIKKNETSKFVIPIISSFYGSGSFKFSRKNYINAFSNSLAIISSLESTSSGR